MDPKISVSYFNLDISSKYLIIVYTILLNSILDFDFVLICTQIIDKLLIKYKNFVLLYLFMN